MDQKTFTAACHQMGLGSTEGGRVERGDVTFKPMHHNVFATVLRITPEWFTASVDDLLRADEAPGLTAEQSDGVLGRLLAGLDQVADRAQQETLKPQADEGRSGSTVGGGGA